MRGIAIAAIAACASLTVPVAAQDVAAGRTTFEQCSPCHSIEGDNGAGPSLQGVYGRKAGTFAGFRYSSAMKSANVTWDDKSLDAYLANPQEVIPDNLMPFSGIAEASQRAGLVAYIKTLK